MYLPSTPGLDWQLCHPGPVAALRPRRLVQPGLYSAVANGGHAPGEERKA